MGKLQVRYPFGNTSDGPFSNSILSNMKKFFAGENSIGERYGSYSIGTASGTEGYATMTYIPSFMKNVNSYNGFSFRMSKATSSDGYLDLSRVATNTNYGNLSDYQQNTMYYHSSTTGNSLYGRDYTKIPFYSYETDSTYLFAIDDINNFFMITEKTKIDDRSIKSCSIITRKIIGGSDNCPLGFYEFDDSVTNGDASVYTNLYTDTNMYNAHNVGYCSKYSLYQYTRNGYIYHDIYYCDGGLSVPPDGIVRIGTSKFMKLGSNLFLRID